MAIKGFDQHSFGLKLHTLVSPSRPIRSIEHLFGREKQLDRIRKALYAQGRHIFISILKVKTPAFRRADFISSRGRG